MSEFGNITVHEAESNFKKVHKSIIFNKGIDCITLGIYVRIMTLGKSWRLNINGLSTHLELSDSKIRAAIKSLEKEGYIKRVPVRLADGKFKGWNYDIYDQPIHESDRSNVSETNNRHSEKPHVGKNRLMDSPQYGEHRNTVNRYDNNNRLNLNNRLNNNIRLDIREEVETEVSPTLSNSEIEFVEAEEIQQPVSTTSVATINENVIPARAKKFDFKVALLSVGICEEYANAWMEVRKNKKATNSEQTFKMLCKEFSKAFYASGMSTNDCAEWAIKRDWKGFDYKWVENDLNKNNNGKNIKPNHVQYKEQRLAEMQQDIIATAQRARDKYYSGQIDRGDNHEDIPI